MEGKIILITGAAQGIGYATAKAFAEAGASVALADFDEHLVNQAADRLSAPVIKRSLSLVTFRMMSR